jgi:hypothetical protein
VQQAVQYFCHFVCALFERTLKFREIMLRALAVSPSTTWQALQRRSGPASLVLDNLEAIQEQQHKDVDCAESACRLRTAILVGFDELLYCSKQQQQQQGAPSQGPAKLVPPVRSFGAGKAQLQRSSSSQPQQQQPQQAICHPVMVVGVAGGQALSIDDGLARCFTAAKVGIGALDLPVPSRSSLTTSPLLMLPSRELSC